MIVSVVQARMGSKRCPGKVLATLAGKPVLSYLLDRIERCEGVDDIIVATSEERDDDVIEDFCATRGTAVFRGSLENVASRFVAIMESQPATGYMRANADSPFSDPAVIDELIEAFHATEPDLVTNVMPRSFPKGVSAEVIEPQRYLEAYSSFSEPGDFEHVTAYYYAHAERFNVVNVSAAEDLSGESLTVDEPSDLVTLEKLVKRMDRPHWQYGWEELLSLHAEINAPSDPP